MDQLQRFKCFNCKIIPDSDVFQCENNHIVCNKCYKKDHGVCECLNFLSKMKENPLLKELTAKTKEPCEFKNFGCTWLFTPLDMYDHLNECKFRNMSCIGVILNTWQCDWKGQLSNMETHFKECHMEPFKHFQFVQVPFDENNNSSTCNLMSAFNKNFVFYYRSDKEKKMVYFVIFLIGRKIDAEQFYYDVAIKSSDESQRMIKFIENCYHDGVNIENIISTEKCVALTTQTIKNHINHNKISLRVTIAKKVTDENLEQSLGATVVTVKNPMPKELKKNKDFLRSTSVKSSSNTPPTSPSILPSTLKKLEFSPTVLRTDPFNYNGYTSINKLKITDGLSSPGILMNSPCYLPSINKTPIYDEKVKPELRSQISFSTLHETKPNNYKNVNNKMNGTQIKSNSFGKQKYK